MGRRKKARDAWKAERKVNIGKRRTAKAKRLAKGKGSK